VDYFWIVGYDWTANMIGQPSKIFKAMIGCPVAAGATGGRVNDVNQDEALLIIFCKKKRYMSF
jgi:hypothetical protein